MFEFEIFLFDVGGVYEFGVFFFSVFDFFLYGFWFSVDDNGFVFVNVDWCNIIFVSILDILWWCYSVFYFDRVGSWCCLLVCVSFVI